MDFLKTMPPALKVVAAVLAGAAGQASFRRGLGQTESAWITPATDHSAWRPVERERVLSGSLDRNLPPSGSLSVVRRGGMDESGSVEH